MKGTFIVLEGVDGCGKGTVIKRLASELFEQNKNNHIYLTREPYNREWLNKFLSQPEAQKRGEDALKLFIEDRKKHCKIIETLLKERAIILSDRYKHTTYAYQMAQGMDYDTIHKMHTEVLVPELTIILDIPVEEAIKRMDGRGSRNQFEQQEFLTKVRNNYLALKEKLGENIIVIDGSKDRDTVYKEVQKIVEQFLKEPKTL